MCLDCMSFKIHTRMSLGQRKVTLSSSSLRNVKISVPMMYDYVSMEQSFNY